MARPFGTHCRSGLHEFTVENTQWNRSPKSPSGWARQCIACNRERQRAEYDWELNNEKMRKYRATEAGKEAQRKARKAYSQTPKGREKIRENNARWAKAHRERSAAYSREHKERWQRFPSGTPADLIETARLVAQLKKELKR